MPLVAIGNLQIDWNKAQLHNLPIMMSTESQSNKRDPIADPDSLSSEIVSNESG